VLGFFVSAEIHFSLEGAAAQIAGEGFESRVFAAVCDQVRGL